MKKIKFLDFELTLVESDLSEGATAPSFEVVSQDLTAKTLSDFEGKTKIITTFPSIDTVVCAEQIKKFNKEAVELASKYEDIEILGISKDLPFAQDRFIKDNNITNMTLLSDYQKSSFGTNYGLLIQENLLLARAILIVDKNNVVKYLQIVPVLETEPDYDAAFEALGKLLTNEEGVTISKSKSSCGSCGI
ncbi:MAG: thiol peroxidase [bacterium]|nr:thiol peroxidase [bacterium]